MTKRCEQFQARLADMIFDRAEIDQNMRQHLSGCPECAAYAAQLRQVQAALDSFALDNEVNEAQIKKAFLLAEAVDQKQQAWREALLFILAAVVTLLATYGLCALFDANLILYVQGFFYVLTPVLLIPLMRKRASRTDLEGDFVK